jgi:uncharacterized protein YndB with AHSA1/START domain
MSEAAKLDTQDIVVEEVFPHAPDTIWKALTTNDLIARWLTMPTTGFEPVKGKHFTFQTTPAGAWDGVIRCQVLEVMLNERLVYSWKGGHEGNVGYGARHSSHVDLVHGRERNAPSPCPLRLRGAQERQCFQEYERRLEEGRPNPQHHRCGTGVLEPEARTRVEDLIPLDVWCTS